MHACARCAAAPKAYQRGVHAVVAALHVAADAAVRPAGKAEVGRADGRQRVKRLCKLRRNCLKLVDQRLRAEVRLKKAGVDGTRRQDLHLRAQDLLNRV
jgi:anti-sigma factor RsiW